MRFEIYDQHINIIDNGDSFWEWCINSNHSTFLTRNSATPHLRRNIRNAPILSSRCVCILGSPRPASRIGIFLKWIFIIFTNGFPTEFSVITITIIGERAIVRKFRGIPWNEEEEKNYLYWKYSRSINQKPIKLLAYLCKNKKLSCQSSTRGKSAREREVRK